jgi:Right handed beta helix region
MTQIADLSRVSARFVIRNNKYFYNRARGLLLQSSFGLVENNSFVGQTGHGIVVGAAPGAEGPGVQNVVFRANQFSKVGSFPPTRVPANQDVRYGALIVAVQGNADNVVSSIPVHENLIFDSNDFSDLQGPGLFLTRANAVVVVNNHFKNTNLSGPPVSDLGTATLGGSVVVTHAHNLDISNNSTQRAGPVSIDTQSTDGVKQ